jgi:hypothetical protein
MRLTPLAAAAMLALASVPTIHVQASQATARTSGDWVYSCIRNFAPEFAPSYMECGWHWQGDAPIQV